MNRTRLLVTAGALLAMWACGMEAAAQVVAPAMKVEAVLENGKHVVRVVPDLSTPYSIARVQVTATTYQLIVAVPGANGQPPVLHSIPLVIGGALPGPTPNPTPTPTPVPTPTPPPPPTPKVAFIYLIHESGDSTSVQAKTRDAKAWKDAADGLGIKWLVIDKDQALAKFPVATKTAIATGLPALVALDKAGVAVAEKQPETIEALTAAVKRLGGAK
jgi:hypothetical protein